MFYCGKKAQWYPTERKEFELEEGSSCLYNPSPGRTVAVVELVQNYDVGEQEELEERVRATETLRDAWIYDSDAYSMPVEWIMGC